MSYRLTDIKHETHDFWVLAVDKGHEVYAKGITHSTRCGIFGAMKDGSSLQRSIDECNRRQTLKDSQ